MEHTTTSDGDAEIELKRRRERRQGHLTVDVDRRVVDRREGSRRMRLRSLWLRIIGGTNDPTV